MAKSLTYRHALEAYHLAQKEYKKYADAVEQVCYGTDIVHKAAVMQTVQDLVILAIESKLAKITERIN